MFVFSFLLVSARDYMDEKSSIKYVIQDVKETSAKRKELILRVEMSFICAFTGVKVKLGYYSCTGKRK